MTQDSIITTCPIIEYNPLLIADDTILLDSEEPSYISEEELSSKKHMTMLSVTSMSVPSSSAEMIHPNFLYVLLMIKHPKIKIDICKLYNTNIEKPLDSFFDDEWRKLDLKVLYGEDDEKDIDEEGEFNFLRLSRLKMSYPYASLKQRYSNYLYMLPLLPDSQYEEGGKIERLKWYVLFTRIGNVIKRNIVIRIVVENVKIHKILAYRNNISDDHAIIHKRMGSGIYVAMSPMYDVTPKCKMFKVYKYRDKMAILNANKSVKYFALCR